MRRSAGCGDSHHGDMMRTLQVALAERSYPIHIGQGLLTIYPLKCMLWKRDIFTRVLEFSVPIKSRHRSGGIFHEILQPTND